LLCKDFPCGEVSSSFFLQRTNWPLTRPHGFGYSAVANSKEAAMVTTGARFLVVLAVLALFGFPGGADSGRRGPPIEVVIEGRAGERLALEYDPAGVTVWRDAARTGIAPLGA